MCNMQNTARGKFAPGRPTSDQGDPTRTLAQGLLPGAHPSRRGNIYYTYPNFLQFFIGVFCS